MGSPVHFSETGESRSTDPMIGVLINGRYRIVSVAGSGGMGRIYRAEQIPLGRPAALKVLNPAYTSSTKDDGFQKRFFLEASILSRLQHPNIVTVFDYGCIEGSDPEAYFMAMEFLDGETLEQRQRRDGPLSVAELMPILRQIARGLRDAHQQGVVHRDLKPSNVMLVARKGDTSLVKIVDFGLVKVLGTESDQITREGTFLGSVRYMSPEQITHGRVDLRTDIYSFGILMYEALCGLPPFEGDHMAQTLMAHVHTPVPDMWERNPSVRVPAAVEGFVRRCLAKFPEERPNDMDAVLAEIDICCRALGYATASNDRYDVDSGAITRSGNFPRGAEVPTRAEIRAPDMDEKAAWGELPTRAEVRSSLEVPTEAEVLPPTFEASDQPSVQPSRSRKLLLFGALAAGILSLVVVALAFLLSGSSTSPDPLVSSSSASSAPRSPPRTFVLWIDSSPSGAHVFEEETVLGTTPMQISIDNEQVRVMPKRLTIRSPGHQPYSLVQGPSEENVRVAAALMKASKEAGEPKPTGRPASPREAPTHKPTSTPQPVDPGIRLHR